MNNLIQHKNCSGAVEFSKSDGVFYGKVLGVGALISYEGATAEELEKDFHEAVDEYLILCERGKDCRTAADI